MTRTLVFLDVETDSLGPSRRVWEVGMIKRDETGDHERQFFVALDMRYSDPASLRIGGFFDRHPVGRKMSGKADDGKPCDTTVLSRHDAAKEVARWTFDATIVGANPAFDVGALDPWLRAEGYLPSWHYRLMDVEAICAGSFGRVVGGLASCAEALDLPPYAAHTALGDARAARDVWDAVMGA